MKKPSKIKASLLVRADAGEAERNETRELSYAPLGTGGCFSTLRIRKKLSGTVVSASAELTLEGMEKVNIFMNGYQTWTYCPEYTRKSRIRGLSLAPKSMVERFGLDRYGDYHFVDYPNKKGVLHGESWCYFREGERYLLIASLDESFGYTLFTYRADEGKLYITRDCGGLSVDGEFEPVSLFIAEGTEDEVFDAWFKEMGVSPITKEKLAGYSSWYNRYENITEASILEDLEGCASVLDTGSLFQIDDGWEPHVGDWLEPDYNKFPDGLKPASDAIHKAGFKAGLWLAPFVAQKGSRLIEQHPDWLYKRNGEPWCLGSNWGGFYSLDIDNPEVIGYIETVFEKVFDEWGFDLVKLDFLYGAAPFGTDKETRAGRMIRAMKLLRRVCGEHPILGCGVPVMPAFGLVEYCRVSCDVSLDWDDKPWMRLAHRERVSTRQAMGNTVFRRQLNGRAYLSDPDVFFLRTDNIKLTEGQKYKLAVINALFGGVYLTSDNMGKYDVEQRDLYKRLLRLRAAKVDSVEVRGKSITVQFSLGNKKDRVTFK